MHFSSVRLARSYTSSTVKVVLHRRDALHRIGLPPLLWRAAIDDVRFVEMDMRLDQPAAYQASACIEYRPFRLQRRFDSGDPPARSPISTGGASGACDSRALRTIRSIALPLRRGNADAPHRRAQPYGPAAPRSRCPAAYSRIARSEENQPTCAVFSTLERHQPRRSCQRAATLTLFRGISGEVGRDNEVVVAGQLIDQLTIAMMAHRARTRRRDRIQHLLQHRQSRQSFLARPDRAGGARQPPLRSGRR